MFKQLERTFRNYFPKYLKNKNIYLDSLKGQSGIEIGGPSFTFTKKGLLPVYPIIKSLDGCNFSSDTIWEGRLSAGNTYRYDRNKAPGYQYISEGNDLPQIENDKYDFVLSCHNLEHFANPVKALYEWKRIVKKDGSLLLILPNKEKTFDHNRPVTTIDHLFDDYRNNMPETDETHFEESLMLCDISMDTGILSAEHLRERTYKNFENRCVHHHVFDRKLTEELIKKTNFELVALDLLQVNIFVLAKNLK